MGAQVSQHLLRVMCRVNLPNYVLQTDVLDLAPDLHGRRCSHNSQRFSPICHSPCHPRQAVPPSAWGIGAAMWWAQQLLEPVAASERLDMRAANAAMSKYVLVAGKDQFFGALGL